MTFQRLAQYDWQREALPDEQSSGDVRRRMAEDGDHRTHLLDLRKQIANAIKAMRSRVRGARLRRSQRHMLDEDQKAGRQGDGGRQATNERGVRGRIGTGWPIRHGGPPNTRRRTSNPSWASIVSTRPMPCSE